MSRPSEIARWALARCEELERRLLAVERYDVAEGSKGMVSNAIRLARGAHKRAIKKSRTLLDFTFRYNPEHYVNGKDDPLLGIQRDVDTMEKRTTEAEVWAPQLCLW